MLNKLRNFGFLLCGVLALSSCKDDDGVGLSIQPDEDILNTYSGSVKVKSSTSSVDSVLSKSYYLYLGQYTDKNFGISRSEFMTQIDGRIGGLSLPDTTVAPSSKYNGILASILNSLDEKYGDIESITSPSDVKLDSISFYIQYSDSYLGDSVSLQSISIYELNKDLPVSNKQFSNVNPSDFYSEDGLLGSLTYSIKGKRTIRVALPNEYGEKLLKSYIDNAFSSQEEFSKQYKGFYIKHSFNEGAIINCSSVGIQLYYSYDADIKTKYEGRDTVVRASKFEVDGQKINPLISSFVLAANKGVEQINLFSHPDLAEKLENELNKKELFYSYTPAGLYGSISLPFDEVMASVKQNAKDTSMVMFNSARLCVRAKYIDWVTRYSKSPNKYMLLIERDKMIDFFYNNEEEDSQNSFVAVYDSTQNVYAFDLTRAAQMKLKGENTLKDMVLVPVSASVVDKRYFYKQMLSPTATMFYSDQAVDSLAPFFDFVYTERK